MTLEIIGITGGIASGKTKATQYLERNGYHVIDCDIIYHELLQQDDTIPRALMNSNAFPQNCFNIHENNSSISLNKKNLRDFLFHSNPDFNSNPNPLKTLGNITHPFIFAEVMKRINYYTNQYNNRNTHNNMLFKNKLFIAIPLLFERWALWQPLLKQVWSIEVSEPVQRKRLQHRCKMQQTENSIDTMYNIIKHQSSALQRQSIATFLIDNNAKPWIMLKSIKIILKLKLKFKFSQ